LISFSFVLIPIPELQHPFTPKVLRIRERAPTPSSFVIFTFGFAFESIKEFGGLSMLMQKQHWKKLQSMASMFKFKHVTSKLSKSCYQGLITIEIIEKVYQKLWDKGCQNQMWNHRPKGDMQVHKMMCP
jgi:hypothetical protein